MKKINTLKKNYEFKNVIKKGKYYIRKHIIVYISENRLSKNVIGVAVSTKTCNAVNRNKIKRLIRESYYVNRNKIKNGFNIVFLWNKKTSINNLDFYTIRNEINEIFKEAKIFSDEN